VTDYDPYDDDAHRKEARLLAAQDAINHRLQLLADRRPAAFDDPANSTPLLPPGSAATWPAHAAP
jgi:hypothetical protein